MADEHIENEQTNDVPDSLDSISDDDLLNMSEEELAQLGTEDEPEEEEAASEEEEETEVEEDSDSSEAGGEEDSGTEQEEETDVDDNTTDDESGSDESASEEAEDEKDEKADTSLSDEVKTKLDSYDELFKPFTANGVDIQVENVEDARRLMQMGAGFAKKMADIKPIRKVGKMLQDNDLLDEDKLNFLIDVSKGNPDAITKLIKDNDIDPLSLDTQKETEYKPNTYNATDEQVELSDIIQPLAGTESGQVIIDTVSNKWDSQSQEVIAKSPQILTALDGHKQSGAFDKIMAKMTLDKALGKHAGKSDIEMYHAIGEEMFGQAESEQEAQPEKKEAPEKQEKPKVEKKSKSNKADKKALASRNQQQAEKAELDIDALAELSDEEFEKRYAAMNF